MRISAKGRYALAVMTEVAAAGERVTPVLSVAEKLGASKVYLEQVFNQLKKSELLVSEKGSRGGYRLSRRPRDITAYDILLSCENAVSDLNGSGEDSALSPAFNELVFAPLNAAIKTALSAVTLERLVEAGAGDGRENFYMMGI